MTLQAPSGRFFPETGLFPIDFTAAAADGHHAAYFVKPEDTDSSKFRLQFEIRNVWHDMLTLEPIAPDDLPGTHHLKLCLRPGLVDGRTVRKALPLANELEQQLGSGWKWHDLHTDTTTGVISVCFSYAPDDHAAAAFEWKQGQTLGIHLRPFEGAPLSGAFFLRAELDYGNLPGLLDLDYMVKVREVNLAVVDQSGQTFFPGKAEVRGSNTILNTGWPNSRTIKVWNAVNHSAMTLRPAGVDHETGSTITVAIRCHDEHDGPIADHPSVLGTKNELQHMLLDVSGQSFEGESAWEWSIKPHQDVPGWLSWEVTPNPQQAVTHFEIVGRNTVPSPGAAAAEALEFRLDNLKSSAPDGVAYVYFHFHHFPGLADHTLMVALERTPVVVRGQNVGIGIEPAADDTGDLYVRGSVHSGGHGGGGLPVGAIIAFGGSAAPDGWLLCDGTPISPVAEGGKYAELCRVLGANAVPDLRGRSHDHLTYIIKY